MRWQVRQVRFLRVALADIRNVSPGKAVIVPHILRSSAVLSSMPRIVNGESLHRIHFDMDHVHCCCLLLARLIARTC
jgi:hypothetical protein